MRVKKCDYFKNALAINRPRGSAAAETFACSHQRAQTWLYTLTPHTGVLKFISFRSVLVAISNLLFLLNDNIAYSRTGTRFIVQQYLHNYQLFVYQVFVLKKSCLHDMEIFLFLCT